TSYGAGEGVSFACAVAGLVGARGGREVAGLGPPRHVRLPGGIDGYTGAPIIATAAEVSRIHERRAAGVDLGDERVISCAGCGLLGVLSREVIRCGLASDICIA